MNSSLEALTQYPSTPMGLRYVLLRECRASNVENVAQIVEYAQRNNIQLETQEAFGIVFGFNHATTFNLCQILSLFGPPACDAVVDLLNTKSVCTLPPGLIKWGVETLAQHYNLDATPNLIQQIHPSNLARRALKDLGKKDARDCIKVLAPYLDHYQAAELTMLFLMFEYTACAKILLNHTTPDLVYSAFSMNSQQFAEKHKPWLDNIVAQRQRAEIAKHLPTVDATSTRKM